MGQDEMASGVKQIPSFLDDDELYHNNRLGNPTGFIKKGLNDLVKVEGIKFRR